MAKQPAAQDVEAGRRPSAGDRNRSNPPKPLSKELLLFDSIRAAGDDLVYKANSKTTLNLATLQRLLLFHLRVDMIEEVGKLIKPDGQAHAQAQVLQGLRKSVADYGRVFATR